MTPNLKLICRLCLNDINGSYEVIQDTHHEMIDFVIGKALQNIQRCLMCSGCRKILQKCYDFKSSCLYLQENPTTLLKVAVSCNLKICRLCGGLVKPDLLVSLNGKHLEVEIIKSRLTQRLSELDMLSTLDSLICNLCYNFLPHHLDFINTLSNIEKRLQSNRYQIVPVKDLLKFGLWKSTDYISRLLADDGNGMNQIKEESTVPEKNEIRMENGKLVNIKTEDIEESNIYSSTSREISSTIKYEDIKVENVDIDEEFGIKFGSIHNALESVESSIDENEDINLENMDIGETEELVLKMNDNNETLNNALLLVDSVYVDIAETLGKVKEENFKSDDKIDTISDAIETVVNEYCVDENEPDLIDEEETPAKNEVVDSVKTTKKTEKRSRPRPEPKEYFSKSVLRAKIKRINVSGQKLYQCEICQIRIKAKCSMNRHMEIHRDPSELTFFYCDKCSYKARSKSDIAAHVLSHLTTYFHKCDGCSFKTNYKQNLAQHMGHCGTKYQCENCPFTSERKASFVLHMRKYQMPRREPTKKIFKCDKCPCTTMTKSGLLSHKKLHKHPSETDIYKCSLCSYESRYRKRVTTHMENHREFITCKYCQFRTKYTRTIKGHTWRVHGMNFRNFSPQTEMK